MTCKHFSHTWSISFKHGLEYLYRNSNRKSYETTQEYQLWNRMEPIVFYNMQYAFHICHQISSDVILSLCAPKVLSTFLGIQTGPLDNICIVFWCVLHWSFQILAIEFRWHLRSIQLDITIAACKIIWFSKMLARRSVKHQGPADGFWNRSRQQNNGDVKWYQVYPTNSAMSHMCPNLYICRNRWVINAFSLSPCFAWYHYPVISMISLCRPASFAFAVLSFLSFFSFSFALPFLISLNGSKAGLGWCLFSFHSRACHLHPWCKPRIQKYKDTDK